MSICYVPKTVLNALNVILSNSHSSHRDRYCCFSDFVSEETHIIGELTYLGSHIKKWQGENFKLVLIQEPTLLTTWACICKIHNTTFYRTNTKKILPFYHRGLECKSKKSRDIWKTGKFGLGVQNEAEQRLRGFCQENTLVIASTCLQQHRRWLYTWTSLNIEIRLIMLFVVKGEETKTQDQELIVAQIMSSLLQNSGLNWRT